MVTEVWNFENKTHSIIDPTLSYKYTNMALYLVSPEFCSKKYNIPTTTALIPTTSKSTTVYPTTNAVFAIKTAYSDNVPMVITFDGKI